MKESERRQIYADKCMKFLTFLDYATIQSVGASYDSKYQQQAQEIKELKKQINEMYDKLETADLGDSFFGKFVDELKEGVDLDIIRKHVNTQFDQLKRKK